MRFLSALARFSCQACGRLLPYFEVSHTIRRLAPDGPFASATCRSCGANWRLAMGTGWLGRVLARLSYLLPLVLVFLIALRALGTWISGSPTIGLVLIWGGLTMAILQLTSALTFRFLFRLEAP